jgi:hypothetical protein
VPLQAAQAREVYCASDEEAADLHGGVLEVILGPRTQMVQESSTPDGRTNTVWTSQAQQCPFGAKEACQGRVDHANSIWFTRLVSVSVAADLTGTNTAAHWIPIMSATVGYAVSKVTSFDVALSMNIYPGQTWQPVVAVSETNASGHYVGGYRHVGDVPGCHQYVLDPNMTFGHYQVTLQDNPVSTWMRQ